MDESRPPANFETTEDAPAATKKEKIRKIRNPIEKTDWPYHTSIDLESSVKPKIAFWSGEERKYYPENPGHSKLAQVFVANSLKGYGPGPNYAPPLLGVNKPISRLGYGIGGLLEVRFKKLGKHETRPDPGTYFRVQQPPLWTGDQLTVSFGSGVVLPRFGRPPSLNPPGPGSYKIIGNTGGCKSLKVQSAFGSKRCIEPTTVTICTVTSGELCSVCGQEQRFDYYRTKTRVNHPDSKVAGRPEIVALCRKCYCLAWNGHHAHWNAQNLLWLFHKCRHCSYVHEHRNLPLVVNKARVKDIKKLTAKESVLAKYFSDHCQPELKQ